VLRDDVAHKEMRTVGTGIAADREFIKLPSQFVGVLCTCGLFLYPN